MRKYIQLLLLVSATIGALQAIGQSSKQGAIEFFDPETFWDDTLTIRSRFIECGEWGGHLEVVKVYLKDKAFHLSFQKYSVNCDVFNKRTGEPKQLLISSASKKLMEKEKGIVAGYMHTLLNTRFRKDHPSQVGQLYEISNQDKSINITVYTLEERVLREYSQFLKDLLGT